MTLLTEKFWFALLVVLCLTVGLAGLVASTPVAYAACSAPPRTPSSYVSQAGAWNTGFSGPVGGVYAQIAVNPPYVYGSHRGEVVDWVMLTDRSAPGRNWSQIGLSYSQGYGTEIFTQVTIPSYPFTESHFGSAASAGSVPTFTVLYNYVPGRFTYQLNGSQYIPPGLSGGYNPIAYFTPHDVEVFAETQNLADQMPGGTANHTGHFNAHFYYNGAWSDGFLTTTQNLSYGLDPSQGNLAYSNGKQFYIWDGQCTT